MNWVFKIFMDSKKEHRKDKAEKESRILICLLVSLQERGTCHNFRPHLDTKPDLGFWGKQGCMSLISFQSLLYWPTFQRWTRILFIVCFTPSSHQLTIPPADKFQYLQDYTFQLWIWIHNLHNLKTKWNIWNQDWMEKKTNQRYTALNTYCGQP